MQLNPISFKGIESTFCMVKPDGVQDRHIGDIISMIEKDPSLTIDRLEMTTLKHSEAVKHYEEHVGKGFFNNLINYITSGNVVKIRVTGEGAIKKIRDLSGNLETPETIRYNYARNKDQNAFHSSDSPQSAERELKIHHFTAAV